MTESLTAARRSPTCCLGGPSQYASWSITACSASDATVESAESGTLDRISGNHGQHVGVASVDEWLALRLALCASRHKRRGFAKEIGGAARI